MRPVARAAAFACLLLSAVAAADANTFSGSGLPPDAFEVAGVGVGAAVCQDAVAAAPLGCSSSGWGIRFDVSSLTGGGSYASGSCTVSNSGALVQGPFVFTCGTDRDDDGLVTNTDLGLPATGGRTGPIHAEGLLTSGPVVGAASVDPDGWDDDFATSSSGASTSASVNVCFRSDVAVLAAAGGLVQDLNGAAAGTGAWDDVFVFVGQDGASVPTTVGSVSATLTLATGSGCPGNVSGHTHG